LLQLQEVAFDYNEDLDLKVQFDSNDIKLIENDKEIDMKSSVFLRYIPIPLVRKAHIRSEQEDFLQIFKKQSYEKATLIWNIEMRNILTQQINFNSDQLIKDLIVYVKRRTILDEA